MIVSDKGLTRSTAIFSKGTLTISGGPNVEILILADVDIYFQYVWMWMLKIMQISGQDVVFLIFTDADIYFQYLQKWMQMWMLRMVAEIQSTSTRYGHLFYRSWVYFPFRPYYLTAITRATIFINVIVQPWPIEILANF